MIQGQIFDDTEESMLSAVTELFLDKIFKFGQKKVESMLFNQGKLENVPIRFEVKNLIKEKSNPVTFGRFKHNFNQAT